MDNSAKQIQGQTQKPQVIVIERNFSPGVAAVLSFFIPGLGQLYKGQPFNGICWFIVTGLGYLLFIIPGMTMHLLCILGALSSKQEEVRVVQSQEDGWLGY